MNKGIIRRRSREVFVGKVGIGANHPISVQSMTNTDTHDAMATYRQTKALEDCGCDIVRITAPTLESVSTFKILREHGIKVPLVADIHFNYKIAVAAIEAGVDKVRINPGNIGSREKIAEVVKAASERKCPIRIGVNSGSLEAHLLKKYGSPTPEALAESALYNAELLEELGFSDIIISVKASSVPSMIAANRILAEKVNYPLHLGVTEAGARLSAAVKSSVGIGTLLAEGIGDTVRVSLTDDPTEEISLAREILSSLGLSDKPRMDIVSCPTCGRTKINLLLLSEKFEERAKREGLLDKNIKVALMGCAVNGPGEASDADIGIAGGVGEALLFKRGVSVRKIPEERIIDELIKEIRSMV
jgi:(E)-4-hydroxy-3-methylbut-2-enyl-diphosphate synthase